MAAPAGIHRRNELHPRREGHVSIGSCNADIAGLEGLPKRIQNTALKFRQLVKEQNAEVGKADFPRTHAQSTADQRRHGGSVMGRAKSTLAGHSSALQLARNRRDHRDFEGLCGL